MKKCPFCDKGLLDSADFCPFCMSPLKEKIPISYEKNRFVMKKLIIPCIALILAVTVALLTVGNIKPNDNSNWISSNVSDNSDENSNSSINDGVSSPSVSEPNNQKPTNNDSTNNQKPDDATDGTTATPQGPSVDNKTETENDDEDTVSNNENNENIGSNENIGVTELIEDCDIFEYSTGYELRKMFGSELIIPETCNGKPILKIAAYAFKDNLNIKKVYIPKTVKIIGQSAFENCVNLTELVISEGVEEIGQDAFTGTAVEHLVIPSTIDEHCCFSSFRNMKTKTITMNCALTDTRYLFSGCRELEQITIAEGLRYISNEMFKDCESLKTIELPNSILGIDNNAFENCKSLKSIKIGKKMQDIYPYVFSECVNLTDIYYDGTKADWNNIHKANNWNKNKNTDEIFNNYTIHCLDGDITL